MWAPLFNIVLVPPPPHTHIGAFVNLFTRWDRWEQTVNNTETQLRSSARGHRPAHHWIHGTPLYGPSPGPHKMTSTAPAIDVKAITALVIESLRNDVAAAVVATLRQQQEDGATT